MSVLINFKICDNAAECGGIEACPTNALFWKEDEKAIGIDNNLCISCGECQGECPVEAIHVVSDEDEYKRVQKVIEQDKRTSEELFVERYGAMPIDEDAVLTEKDVEDVVKVSGVVLIEQFQNNSIQCLLHSIPAVKILEDISGKYFKCQMDDALEGTFPRILIFKDSKYIGKIEGYYADTQLLELKDMIAKMTER